MTHASSRLPELGRRGGGWVVAQTVLLVLIALSALVGLSWPDYLHVPALAVGIALMAFGIFLVIAGSLALGPALSPFPAPRERGRLTERSVYGHVRHPIYGGGILLGAGWSLVFASVVGGVLTLLLALCFDLKSRVEERWLEQRYGEYADYRRRTRRRFVPGVY